MNIEDVFDKALEIEQKGEKYYRGYALIAENKEVKDILNFLADMEVIHKNIFYNMKLELKENEKSQKFELEGDSLAYLLPAITYKGHEINVSSIRNVFKDALAMEKDLVVFYTGIKESIKYSTLGSSIKEKLDQIVKEELKHVIILQRELQSL
ncbi:MAG: ferritin family protein [Candidatus Helarchaeota archaeon]